jgi:hypothetical protein
MQTEPSKAEPPKRKRRWIQFSLRTLMIGVTLLAIGCWGGALNRRSNEFHYRALDAGRLAVVNQALPDSAAPVPNDGRSADNHRRLATMRAIYFEVLADKYDSLAARPWFNADPDPPLPNLGSADTATQP